MRPLEELLREKGALSAKLIEYKLEKTHDDAVNILNGDIDYLKQIGTVYYTILCQEDKEENFIALVKNEYEKQEILQAPNQFGYIKVLWSQIFGVTLGKDVNEENDLDKIVHLNEHVSRKQSEREAHISPQRTQSPQSSVRVTTKVSSKKIEPLGKSTEPTSRMVIDSSDEEDNNAGTEEPPAKIKKLTKTSRITSFFKKK